MTDENWKSGILDEDYFSDEELRDAFINPDKKVILKKTTKSFEVVQSNLTEEQYAEIDKEDLIYEAILAIYDEFSKYKRENAVLLLDQLTIKDMEFFVNNE